MNETEYHMNNRRFLSLFAAALLAVLTTACAAPVAGNGPQVVATAYPLVYFAQQIAGDPQQVVGLIPPGVEPHDWEPSPRDLVTVGRARLFVYNGAGLEPWAERVLQALGGSAPTAVEATKGLPLMAGTAADGSEEAYDPHVWLDPVLAQGMADRIAEGLAGADASNAARYRGNAARLKARLGELDQKLRAGLSGCRLKTFIASHTAFGYFAKRYGLQQLAIAGLSPEASPSPARMADLVLAARSTQSRFVFFETLASPALAQTLAREAGLQPLVLNPVEGFSAEDLKAGQDYFTAMDANLGNLRRALECVS